MKSRKMVLMKLFAGQQWRYRDQTYGHGAVGREEGRMNRESTTETYALPYVK